VTFTYDRDPGPHLRSLIQRTGEVLGDPSWLPAALLFERARERAVVFLSGEGGDELLLGYDRHRFCALASAGLALHLPHPPRMLLGLAPAGRPRRALAALRGRDLPGILAAMVGLLPPEEWRDLVHPELAGSERTPLEEALTGACRRGRGAAAAGRMDLLTYLPGDLLPKGDRAAMASGAEVFCPFLDPPLVEHALVMPARRRLSLRRGKLPLRDLLRHRLPDHLLRRRKRGFGVPLHAWLVRGAYGRFAEELLGDLRAPFQGVLRTGEALSLLQTLRAGRADLAPLVHACVALALFHDAFLARAS